MKTVSILKSAKVLAFLSLITVWTACQEEEVVNKQNEDAETKNSNFIIDKQIKGILFSESMNAINPDTDTNGDGVLSFDELVAVFPDATEELFMFVDVNSDGAIDAGELFDALAAGVLVFKPKPKEGK